VLKVLNRKNNSRYLYVSFLKEYFQNIRGIGSICPDSSFCVKELLKAVPFEPGSLIIEFGSASGTVTREILKRKNLESTLICFEKNSTFFTHLAQEIRGENVHLINEDVFNSVDILASQFGIQRGKVDCIISTLPCSSIQFDELLRKAVIPLLNENGLFVQYMHTLSTLKGFYLGPVLKKYFNQIEMDFVLRNFPPVLIYTCRSLNDYNRAPAPPEQ
jgi:phospholipid N-methyltransferase